MLLKRAYYYLYYKLYKFSEAAPSRWWSEWKAGLALDVLVFMVFLSLTVYYAVFVDRHFQMPDGKIITILCITGILLPNYFIFNHNNRWKAIVSDFDKLPQRRNLIGGFLVLVVIILIVANLIFAFYLMSRIQWDLYR